MHRQNSPELDIPDIVLEGMTGFQFNSIMCA